VVQGLHPGIDIEGAGRGEAVGRRGIRSGRDPAARARQQLVTAYPGERLLLGIEENVDQDTVLGGVLIRRQVGGDVETSREPGKLPGIDVGRLDD
jgi:hypothetical protein